MEPDRLTIHLRERGTARIGGLGILWPFSLLEVSPDELTISGFAFGKYSFKPTEVVSLQPSLWGGIRINHTCSDYPGTIIFISDFRFAIHRFRLSKDLLREIEMVGFIPSGHPEDRISGRGLPFRRWAILSVVGIWALLLLWHVELLISKRERFLGVFALLLFTSFASFAPLCSESLRKLLLKPGRSLSEVRGFLILSAISTGLLAILFGWPLFSGY